MQLGRHCLSLKSVRVSLEDMMISGRITLGKGGEPIAGHIRIQRPLDQRPAEPISKSQSLPSCKIHALNIMERGLNLNLTYRPGKREDHVAGVSASVGLRVSAFSGHSDFLDLDRRHSQSPLIKAAADALTKS